MSQPARTIFSFDSWDRDHPGERPPGDRLDAQFAELLRGQALILEQLDAMTRVLAAPVQPAPLSDPPNALGYAAGGFYATDPLGAAATAADYAQVSIEWAEHLPDTIPPNILAINAITGDHWSSRWWASKAAQIVSQVGVAGSIYPDGVFAEALTVTGANTLSALTKDPAGPVLLLVNNSAFLPVGSPPSFAVVGRIITWMNPLYSLQTTDAVAAWYPYGHPEATPPKNYAISLNYVATQGQTQFPVTTADYYGNSYGAPVGAVEVTRNGLRMMPDLGSGVGGFTRANATVTLTMPAGAGEIVIIDVWGTA